VKLLLMVLVRLWLFKVASASSLTISITRDQFDNFVGNEARFGVNKTVGVADANLVAARITRGMTGSGVLA
jgi:hypothetical protein